MTTCRGIILIILLIAAGAADNENDDRSSLQPTVEHQHPHRHASAPTKPEAFGETPEEVNLDVEGEFRSEEKSNASREADSSAPANKRLWGAAASAPSAGGHASAISSLDETDSTAAAHEPFDTEGGGVRGGDAQNGTKISNNIPFLASNKAREHHHPPPDGFVLSARVYIDPSDRLAHFDENAHQISLPYWDCGASGATTSPIPLKNGYFRHALASTTTSWTGTDGKHAVLAIALSPFLLELNSEESQTFSAGDVILLEDVLLSGHRMRPLAGRDLKVLFLTLPQQHLHTGKKHMSLSNLMVKHSQGPCPDIVPGEHQDSFLQASSTVMNSIGSNGRRIRLLVMAAVGMSVSTLMADFLGKTAPLWLAVGVGGTCFVAGSTYAITMLGDRLWAAVELWREERLLNLATIATTTTTTTQSTTATMTTMATTHENDGMRERIEVAIQDHATEAQHAQEAEAA